MPNQTKAHAAVVELLSENAKSQMTGIGPRDSDKELLIQFMQRIMGMELKAFQLDLIRSMNFESIRRTRQKLQEAGAYPPDNPEVARRRRIKGYEIQQTVVGETSAQLQRRLESND